MDNLVGTRVELLVNTNCHRAGERGVVASIKGHVGVKWDNFEGVTICFDGMPILNFVKAVSDEREPEMVQLDMFGGWK